MTATGRTLRSGEAEFGWCQEACTRYTIDGIFRPMLKHRRAKQHAAPRSAIESSPMIARGQRRAIIGTAHGAPVMPDGDGDVPRDHARGRRR